MPDQARSCQSASNCVVVGTWAPSSGSYTLAETWNGRPTAVHTVVPGVHDRATSSAPLLGLGVLSWAHVLEPGGMGGPPVSMTWYGESLK